MLHITEKLILFTPQAKVFVKNNKAKLFFTAEQNVWLLQRSVGSLPKFSCCSNKNLFAVSNIVAAIKLQLISVCLV